MLANMQGYACSHPLRLAILALLASDRQRECTAADLRSELPKTPSAAVVDYHLGVLLGVGLVSERTRGTSPVYGLA